MDVNDFKTKEYYQSHTFILFPSDTPYTYLGWKKYRHFNNVLNDYLKASGKILNKNIYIHEHEVINIEKCFVWVVSFFEKNIEEQIIISNHLMISLTKLVKEFFKEDSKDIIIANNKEDNINEVLEYGGTLDLHEYYIELVVLGEQEIELQYTQKQKEKTFTMPLPDLNAFEGELNVGGFVQQIDNYLNSADSQTRHEMIFAPDGYWSTKYPALKLFREEFIPLKYFIKQFNISEKGSMHLGFERLTYDACFQSFDKSSQQIVEITAARPDNDHLLLSLFKQSFNLRFPVKNLHKLKLYKDSVPEKIIKAIDEKHDKGYQSGRILIVTLPLEYVYQGEEYIIDEVINEVSKSCKRGIGNFAKIFLLCNGKIKSIF
ncbi:hypothetical protein ACMWOT_002667 [Yersinia enterocolitica]